MSPSPPPIFTEGQAIRNLPHKRTRREYCWMINNSVTDCAIWLKFSTLAQYGSSKAAKWLTSNSVQIQNGRRRLNLTRNSSGDEIANVNFLYDDIVHVLQNTIDSCINSATDRRGYVLECMFTKFSEITQYNGHYAVQGHSRSPILVAIESSYTTSY